MYHFLCIFYIYAFLGWCVEVAYAALTHGKFINRGFLNGPLCPIYGFGVILVLFVLRPLQESWPLLFLGSMLLTSLLELTTGFLLEKIFHQHWWDYSKEPFNLGGFICLRFSLLWGFACVFVADILHPTVLLLIQLTPYPLGVVLLSLSGAAMAVDLTATVGTITKLRRRQSQIDAMAARMRELSNEFGESLAVRVMDAAEAGDELKSELSARAEDARARQERLCTEWKDRQEKAKEELETRRNAYSERLRQAQKEAAELRTHLAQLLEKPISGQRRLLRAFPKIKAALRERIDETEK